MVNLENLKLNRIGNYIRTEFYPKNWILTSGEFNWINEVGKVFTISISIMKINTTGFLAMGPKCEGHSNITGDEECREIYTTDSELEDEYCEELDPEYVCITLVYDANILDYKTISYIAQDVSIINDITNSMNFNNNLQNYINKLFESVIDNSR